MTRKLKSRPKPETQVNTFDDGVPLDLSGIDDTLTDRAKRFVIWYTYPGTDCFQHKTRAAIRAGYAKKNAVSSGYKLCQNPTIKKEIERLSGAYVSEKIDSLYSRYVESLEQRAFYDPADFISGTVFKPIEDIAPGKRIAIDQFIMDKEGKIVGETFGNRRAAMAEIKEIYEKEHPGGGDDDNDDGERTLEIMRMYAESKICIERRKKGEEISQLMRQHGHIIEPENGVHEL